MARTVGEALDELPWERLEPALGRDPAVELRRALRRLARKGAAATEEDCGPLFDCVAPDPRGVTAVATAALPFVVVLAGHPDMGARATLVQLLTGLSGAAAEAGEAAVDAGWHEAWRRHRPRLSGLLVDPRPEVRREALPLAEGVGVLLERWRAETDPAVRLPVLLALGTAAAGSGAAEAAERVREIVAGVLGTGTPAMRVAAVHARAEFDPQAPVRELDLLVEALSDPAARPGFEALWYVPDIDGPLNREDVLSWTARLFEDAPEAALSLVVRLVDAARRTGDTLLCRAALDEGWRLLVSMRSAAPALLPRAGALLGDPDDGVRYRAAHLLAALGTRAAPYADELAGLLDDPGEDEFFEGTVGDHARWALTRIGDRRALPELVERLHAPYKDQYSRGYCLGDPHLPEVEDVLAPLGAHAEILLPAIRRLLRDSDSDGGRGRRTPLTGPFLHVLQAWGPAAAPALPEVVALLDDTRYSLAAVDALVAMGPAAAAVEHAVRRCTVPDAPGNHQKVAWAAWRLGGDPGTALRLIGEAVPAGEGPFRGPVHLLGDFGPAAAPYADRVRRLMENGDTWLRPRAAVALWSITGEPEPSATVLEEDLPPVALGGDSYGGFLHALRALARIGTVSRTARAVLRTVRSFDRPLSTYRDYRAILQDETIRAAIDEVLALP
ncbi:HEAT repeat domain-containing protein [Streptomyces atratus]|uniref:HEAT repeat domain-containing protein n=1 Tax=Streptomyces atratus TaxID=1893 RepID=UPI0021A6E456|nr:HEAT repeat domain-containing protein [Streptomyces atratus]MCT2543650.1 HEAT repeat domain-containing protein [Streptomyces atratus]